MCWAHPHTWTILLLSLFVTLHKYNVMFYFQWSRRQTTKPNGPAFLWYLCDRKKTRGYEFCISLCHGNNQYEFCSQSLTSMWLCLGKTLCNIEQFGQYPLQVNGFNNLDECLEGAMVEKEIESLLSDHSVTSGREVNLLTVELLSIWCFHYLCNLMLHWDNIFFALQRWFKKLPPVLTFELSRFEFNTQLGRPEKIHKKLDFPQIIYMDRWALHR